MININWNQVLTTAIATFLAAVIIGAAAVVWQGATTVQEQVEKSTSNLENTVDYTKRAVQLLDKEVVLSRQREDAMESNISILRVQIAALTKRANPPTNSVRTHRRRDNTFEELEAMLPKGETSDPGLNPADATKGAFPIVKRMTRRMTRQSVQQRLPQLNLKR